MSDNYGVSLDYSSGARTSNDYSSVDDCRSNVQTDNNHLGLEIICSVAERAPESGSSIEPTKAAFDDSKPASSGCSSTTLQQVNDVTTADEALKSQSGRDAPPSSNCDQRKGSLENNYSASYALSNANRNRIAEERWRYYWDTRNRQNHFRRRFYGMLIASIVLAVLFIIMVYIVIFVNYPFPIQRSINSLP